jgi:hypothetical protein
MRAARGCRGYFGVVGGQSCGALACSSTPCGRIRVEQVDIYGEIASIVILSCPRLRGQLRMTKMAE